MDFESPDVEKDFPGLYASESGRKSNESDFSDGGDHDKPSKKHLLGHRKDKKEKKDKGYAALEGDSSPEEDTDAKSPSKSKKTKAFKFPTKSKEKREKSREKDKVLEEAVKQKELSDKEKKHKELSDKEKKKERDKEKEKEKEKKEKKKEKDKEKEEKAKFKLESKEKLKDDKKDKTRDKEKEKSKEKDKDKGKEKDKVKDKDKDKKEKKLTKMPSTVTSGVPFEEIFTLGVALPIFGVPLQQSVERLRCHDDSSLPLVVRDSIDYLQIHGLKSPQIYRGEADKIKLSQLRKLYTDRGSTFPYHWDVPVACAILKSFLSELPESILTIELEVQFSQGIAIAPPQRELTMAALIQKLPTCNHNLLGWLIRHYESVLLHSQANQATIQSISAYMGSALNMSQNLLAYLITNAEKLFPDVRLTKYIPPLLALPADFSECAQDIASELRKQESLLNQIHLEMHAGFITPARDQRLWEAQRIVTQLKRQLRAVQKSVEPNTAPSHQTSVEEKQGEDDKKLNQTTPIPNTQNIDQPKQEETTELEAKPKDAFKIEGDPSPIQDAEFTAEFEDNFEFKTPKKQTPTEKLATPDPIIDKPVIEKPVIDKQPVIDKPVIDKQPVMDKPKLTEEELQKLRLELENAEYQQLKSLLQAKINSEQFEIVKLRSQIALRNKQEGNVAKEVVELSPEEEQRLTKEIALMEQKRMGLIDQLFQERVACLQLKIDLAMKELHSA